MKKLRDRLKERKALRNKVLPMAAYYGREADLERRRGEFYIAMAKAFGWNGWKFGSEAKTLDTNVGRDGRPAKIKVAGRKNIYPVIENTAPLEYLFSKGMLHTDQDERGAALRRLEAGLRLRGIVEGAQISGLQTANLEGASGGGSPGCLPGEYKMECIRWLANLRGSNEIAGLVPSLFSIIEDMVCRDRWVWEEVRVDRRERIILQLHKGLDELSVKLHMMLQRDFISRWYPARRTAADRGSSDPSPHHQSVSLAPQSQSDEPPSE